MRVQRYVSKELTHFVGRDKPEEEQYSILINILQSCWLTHKPHNQYISGNLSINRSQLISENNMYSPQVICFCDVPVSDLEIHIDKYSCFGLSFLKSFLIQKGANPVFYVSKNSKISGHDRPLVSRSKCFDKTIPKILEFISPTPRWTSNTSNDNLPSATSNHKIQMVIENFLNFYIFSFIVFFDDEKADDDPDNFYMEREWRMLGNLNFDLNDVYRIFLPKKYAKRFHRDIPKYMGQLNFVGKSL